MRNLRRIVKLHLKKGKFKEFKTIFNYGKDVVSGSEGCFGVELLQDSDDPDLVFTFSDWTGKQALDNYRSSDEFLNYWPNIKSLLAEKAEVWSLVLVDQKKD